MMAGAGAGGHRCLVVFLTPSRLYSVRGALAELEGLMGLFKRSKKEETSFTMPGVLLEDEELMSRIDDSYLNPRVDRKNHPDACQECGWVAPGFRECPKCGDEIERKDKDEGYWFQEVAGESHYREVFERLLEGANRKPDGGVHEWAMVALMPEPSNEYDKNAVQVMASLGGPAERVGYIPRDEAAEVQQVCGQVYRDHRRVIACKGLIEGGYATRGGQRAPYEIRLLLPDVDDLPKRVKEGLSK
jgi:hypothetical protein